MIATKSTQGLRGTRLGLGGLLLITACSTARVPRDPAWEPLGNSGKNDQVAGQASLPCATCVRWEIPSSPKLPGDQFGFSDGSLVGLDGHGVRFLITKQPPFVASPYLFEERPQAALELADHTIAWLDGQGASTFTATPLGPPVASHPAPTLPAGENVGTIRAMKGVVFVVGDRGSLLRSSDGGGTWDKIDLGLPPFARFIAMQNKNELGGHDEESYLAGQEKSDQFLGLWFHPMQYRESNDDGRTWRRERPIEWASPTKPRTYENSVDPRYHHQRNDDEDNNDNDGNDGNDGNDDNDDNDGKTKDSGRRRGIGALAAGNQVVYAELDKGKGIELAIGPTEFS
jgi:hypothetical protein